MNHSLFYGRPIYIRENRSDPRGVPPPSSSHSQVVVVEHEDHGTSSPSSSSSNQLFVSNLPWDTAWYQLKDFFSTHLGDGIVPEHVQIVKKGGCATVRFTTVQDAQYAMEKLQGIDFMGRPLDIRLDQRSYK